MQTVSVAFSGPFLLLDPLRCAADPTLAAPEMMHERAVENHRLRQPVFDLFPEK
jgi:hypothetical protein